MITLLHEKGLRSQLTSREQGAWKFSLTNMHLTDFVPSAIHNFTLP